MFVYIRWVRIFAQIFSPPIHPLLQLLFYEKSSKLCVVSALIWCQQKKQQLKIGLHGLVIVLNHYHDKSKDCTTELANLVYLMIGYGITTLKNSLNNNVGKHAMTIFAILLMHRGSQLQRSYGHLLNNKK